MSVPKDKRTDGVLKSYRAWRTHTSKGNNYKLIQRMDRYYKDLWTGGVNGTD